ncbi:PP2C family protein-serine/threonine phosphatase [Marinobacter sp. C2H3]|uniref:PP2C family protein-serine/threonine phosphatase n=1 Tax=Marinobacter sp. C2H3 TaxID=3119003 RepID=UPI00300F26C7
MAFTVAGESHRGAVRVVNQDRVAWRESADGSRALLLLADGMGGHDGGEVASRLAVDAAEEVLKPALDAGDAPTPERLRERLARAFQAAGGRVRAARLAEPRLASMGTTLVAVCLEDGHAGIAHIGDSRCYLMRAGEPPVCLTRDDSVVQNMIDDGSLRPEDAGRAPFRNVLTRAVGTSEDDEPSYRFQTLAPGDALLLCSDGLPEAVAEAEWPAVVAGGVSARDIADRFLARSLEQGAPDNVSLIFLMMTS